MAADCVVVVVVVMHTNWADCLVVVAINAAIKPPPARPTPVIGMGGLYHLSVGSEVAWGSRVGAWLGWWRGWARSGVWRAVVVGGRSSWGRLIK